jgi:hypothetical protein
MSFDWGSDEEYDDYDEDVEFGYGCERVASAAEAARRHLALEQRGAQSVEYLIETPRVVVTLQTQNYASKCSHCGREHHFLTIQRIAAEEKKRGHGSRFMRELLAALPAEFTLRHETRPVGLHLQSVETEDSIGLANGQLGMTPVPGRMLEPPYEKFGDYHLCVHRQ